MPAQLDTTGYISALSDYKAGVAYEKKIEKDKPIPAYMERTHRRLKDSGIYQRGRDAYRANPNIKVKILPVDLDEIYKDRREAPTPVAEPEPEPAPELRKRKAPTNTFVPEPPVKRVLGKKKVKIAPTTEPTVDTQEDIERYESGKPKRDVDMPIHKAKMMKMVPTAYQSTAQPGGSEPTPTLSQNLFLERQRDYTRRQVGPLGTNKKLENFIVEKPLYPSPLDYYESAIIRKQNLFRKNKPFTQLNPFSNG